MKRWACLLAAFIGVAQAQEQDHQANAEEQREARDARAAADDLLGRFAHWGDNPIRAIEMLETVFYRERRAYLVGRVFGTDRFAPIVIAFVLVPFVGYVLARTRFGLRLRAVGENHDAAHAIGTPVVMVRLFAIAFGGAMAGLGGAYLSLVQTPFWVEKMTAGRGWIALALVVFAAWRPARVLLGAYLFGGITIMQLHAQALGLNVDAQILSMLPYLATIAVLVVISRDKWQMRLNAPACLGKIFYAPS